MKIKNRRWKRICSIVLAIALILGAVPLGNLMQNVLAESEERTLKIAVLSDTHYYPISYVSDCDDYTTYVNGDPKLLEESGGILDSASQMVIEDKPDVLLVSGDLTKDGEVKGHEEFSANLQKIQDACPDTQIYVINGNHDINNTDAWTFESGQKVSVESATPDKFSEIYAGFGYNAGRKDTDQIQYYINSEEHPDGRVVGGLSYAAQVNDKFVVLALDSGMYSVDSENGYDYDEHITGGKIDSYLMDWATRVIKEAQTEGKTVIGLMHHGLVPHFTGEEDLFSEYVVADWENVATQLADAGLRYIFTGHMHANDVAEYTTVKGNHITDVETGSLVSYGSPVRSVKLTKNVLSGEESFDISSKSVQSASYIDRNGQTVNINDMIGYEMQKLYPETFLNNMLNGIVTPMLQQMAQSGDLKGTLEGLLTDTDLDATILDVAHSATASGMNLNLGSVGTAVITYQNGAIQVSVSGVGGSMVGDETITDEEVIAIVNDVLSQIQTKYINDPTYVKQILDELATEVSDFKLGVTKDDGSEATLYDLIIFVLTNHYSGHESAPEWVQESVKVLNQGDVIKSLIDELVPSLCNKITPILQNLYVNFDLAFDGSLIKSQLNSNYNNGQLQSLLDGFGFSVEDTVNGLIQEYMSQSFRTGMGQIISQIVEGMVYDNAEDDVMSGAHRVITYSGKMDANPQEATIANGLLPSEVSMTFGSNPQTSKAFKWYTGTSVDKASIRYSTSSDMRDAVEVEGISEEVVRPKTLMNLGLMASYTTQKKMCHKVSLENLSADTTYYYQVGTEDKWSEVASFTTASSDTSKFTAIAVADSQGMVASDYKVFEKTFLKAQSTLKSAEFTMNLGDMVDEGINVDYWDYLTNNISWRAQTMVPVSGNHEAKKTVEGVTGDTVSNQFNMDAILNEVADDSGVYYSFDYKNATFVVLNTNDGAAGISDAQYQWAENVLNSSTSTWKIILMHKSVYSNGPHYNDSDVVALRNKMNQLCAETGVDLVLSGHDHVYNRTPIMVNGTEGASDEEKTVKYDGLKYTQNVNAAGTVFAVIGTSGVKNYEQDTGSGIPSKVSLQPNCPMFSGLTIDENALYFRAYTYNQGTDKASLADSFSLSKVNNDETAYEEVIDMIEKLPANITLDDKADVEAARAAYEVLDQDAKNKVSNYQKLVEAEKTIATLESLANGREVTVTTKAELETALNDSSVTSIKVSGTINCQEKEYVISRNLRIGGSGTLNYGWFRVTSGAQFIMADSFYVDGSRKWGSIYASITPVTVEDNSSVVLENSAHVRTEYGARGNGYGIYLKGASSSAVINSSAQQWASDGVVYGENATSSITINSGSFESKNWNSAISGNGTLTVNGGTKIAGFEIGSGATGYINGGTFTEGTSSIQYTPLVIKGTAYMTAGTTVVSAKTGKALELGGTLYMRPKAASAIKIGGYTPYISSVATDNFIDVSATLGVNNGTNVNTQYDKMYAADSYAANFVGQTQLTANALNTTQDTLTLKAQAPAGTTYVYAKSQYYGSGRSVDVVTGNGNAYLYNDLRTIENYAVDSLEIEGGADYVLLQKDTATQLNVTVKPDNAFNDGVYWTSADGTQTEIIETASGIVNSIRTGTTTITAEAVAYPGVKDTITAITLDVTDLKGPSNVITGSDDNLYAMSLGDGLEGTGLTVKYSVDDTSKAEIDESTGVLTAKEAGRVTVTATAYYNDTELPVSKSVDVVIENLKMELKSEPEEGGTVNADKSSYELNDMARITATANDGYRFVEWKDAAGKRVSTDAEYTTSELKTDASYTAVFAKLYNVTVPDALTGGTVKTDVTQAASGDKVTMTVTPEAGYQLDVEKFKVSYMAVVDGVEKEVQVEVAKDLTFIIPEADVVITAAFVKTPYNITIDPNITNGTITVSGQTGADGSAVIGDEITVTVAPAEGYLLTEGSLLYNGNMLSADENGEYKFVMGAEDVTITVSFEINQSYMDLKEKIEEAEAADTEGMTGDSVDVLKHAIEEAKSALVPDITDATSKEQIQKLEDALNGLQKVKEANLWLVATRGGSIRYDGLEQYDYAGYVEEGKAVTLTAVPEEGAKFMYWQNMTSNRIITEEDTYTFTMGSAQKVKAVFSKPITNQYQVVFRNDTGTVLQTSSVKAGSEVTPPTAVDRTGYKFVRWDTEEYKNVTKDLIVTAVMERDGDYHTVTVINGMVNGSGNADVMFDTKVQLKANNPESDKRFAYWKLQNTNIIVSYEAETSFRVYEDVTLEAVYADATNMVEQKPVVCLSDACQIDGRKVTVTLRRELPTGCTIVEWGLLGKKANVADIMELEYGKENVDTFRFSRTDEDAILYTLSLSGNALQDITVRGYVKYTDETGTMQYVYSDNLVHATVE